MADVYIAAVGESLEAWPIVPFGYKFEREHVLRVWLQVEGDPTQKAPPDAVLFCELPLDLLVKAGLADKNTKQLLLPYMLVPEKYWLWSAGALSFEKVIMTVLQDAIREHALTHKDTGDVREELVWIGPVGEDDLMYYFVVLTQIGIRPRINLEKGNPSFFDGVPSVPSVVGIQQMPDTHFIWEWLLRIEAEGIIRRGVLPDGRNGQALLDTLFRDPIVNFFRALADKFKVEELERKRQRGDVGLSDIHKAFSSDRLFQWMSDDERKYQEGSLLEWWLWEIYFPRLWRLGTKGVRGIGSSEVAKMVMAGLGEWNGSGRADYETARVFAAYYACERFSEMATAGRRKGSGTTDEDMRDEALKAYHKGSVTPQEAAEMDTSNTLTIPDVTAGARSEKDLYDEWLRNFEPKLEWILGPRFVP